MRDENDRSSFPPDPATLAFIQEWARDYREARARRSEAVD